MHVRTWAAASLVLSACGIVLGQQRANVETVSVRRTIPANASSIRLDVRMVLVPVTVTDAYEHLVPGLGKEDFRVFDEGVEQNISSFFRDESPISVGIVFDGSRSMTRRIDMSKRAISMFLSRSLPKDEFFVIRFSDRVEELQHFTTDIGSVEDAVAHIRPNGWTALYDAIHLGINDMRRAAHTNKVLLIVSDGADNNSRYTEREIKGIVQESDVRLFAISIFDKSPTLEKLAEASGGRAYRVRKLDELPELASKVSDELHSQYVLGYAPGARVLEGKYRRVKVELVQRREAPPLRASWRHGYYEPSR